MARKPDPPQRLDFLYDFERREFILRFESRRQAALYQATNNEARILEDHPHDVWLPLPTGMTSLRSSSVGMAVIFQSMAIAEKWQKRTCLGGLATIGEGDAAVYFKRDWVPGEMEEKLSSKRWSLKSPSPSSGSSNSRPNTPRVEVHVRAQTPSRAPYGL
ncbi:hypothetical protein CCMA1212_005345 [Trichoderma ghanense]|uniref:Uncharacterized protein n=1 Tax=Trichoderma ghanense TaxID=65468 RepID=A0ABY2H2W4_9HYPO